jgi:hypothetical protein
MSNANEKNPAEIINSLGDEAKRELLERLADELGFELAEQGDPVNPQSDIVEVLEGAIRGLQNDLGILKAQFAEGAELDFAELNRAAEGLESAMAELSEAHGNLDAVIDSEFDVDDEEEDDDAH